MQTIFTARLLDKYTVYVFNDSGLIHERTIIYSECENRLSGPLSFDLDAKGARVRLKSPFEYGKDLALIVEGCGRVYVDGSILAQRSEFDALFAYDGPLGAIYQKEATSFYLWAPFASRVLLVLEGRTIPMERKENGVFALRVPGDHEKERYHYSVRNFGMDEDTPDPYSYALSKDRKDSIILDFSQCVMEKVPLEKVLDPIIYESHVVDLSNDPSVNFFYRNQFLALTEKGLRSGDLPAGIDYLKYLGITHLQLQPIADCGNRFAPYDWGYDPGYYFVPESNYVNDKDDPYGAIKEVQAMVKSIHSAGIRVILDVVYNHVYLAPSHVFQKVVPGYFYRYDSDGRLENFSYCGNDTATERKMVARYFLDVAAYWAKMFDIDGYRFDLMSLMDISLLKAIEKDMVAWKKDFFLLGEGWSMGYNKKGGTIENAAKVKGYHFFDDEVRERSKWFSANSEPYDKDYPRFMLEGGKRLPLEQSIQYIECHDNETYADWLDKFMLPLSKEEKQEVIRFSLANLLLGKGTPFIHAGQEFGASKNHHDNTYLGPDYLNRLDYKNAAKHQKMVDYLKDLISLRKALKLHRISPIFDMKGEILHITLGQYEIFENASNHPLEVALKKGTIVLFDAKGKASYSLKDEGCILPRHSLLVVAL